MSNNTEVVEGNVFPCGRFVVLHRFYLSDEWKVVLETERGVSYKEVEEVISYHKKFNKHKHQFYVVRLPPNDT